MTMERIVVEEADVNILGEGLLVDLYLKLPHKWNIISDEWGK